ADIVVFLDGRDDVLDREAPALEGPCIEPYLELPLPSSLDLDLRASWHPDQGGLAGVVRQPAELRGRTRRGRQSVTLDGEDGGGPGRVVSGGRREGHGQRAARDGPAARAADQAPGCAGTRAPWGSPTWPGTMRGVPTARGGWGEGGGAVISTASPSRIPVVTW